MTDEFEAGLRDPAQVVSLMSSPLPWSSSLIESECRGDFWGALGELGVTLLVTREYEHVVLALSAVGGSPHVSAMRVPHPSGLVADRERGLVHIACTRNPNQLMTLAPSRGWLPRTDAVAASDPGSPGLVPVSTQFLPGCLYVHDLALIGGRLHANAVGMNAVIDVDERSGRSMWWPKTIETAAGPDLSRNLIQLNSIAGGRSIEESFFTASTARETGHRPGDVEWQVDRQGVVFSGRTREAVVTGLTRPHSARFDGTGRLWLCDSGYGTLDVVDGSRSVAVATLSGWTRGLCLIGTTAVVGTSRVIPRFRAYAPGLDLDASECGLHIVDIASGTVRASLSWPAGNQIFAIDWLPTSVAVGFLGGDPTAQPASVQSAWYHYRPPGTLVDPTLESEPDVKA